MKVVASIGTTHPLAIAGLPLALLALANAGVRPVCIVAGVTAQDAAHVLARAPVAPSAIAAQFDALAGADVAAFHVGALLSVEAVAAVAAGLARYAVPVVLDPVLAATGGDALADAATVDALRVLLVPRAALVTPNLDEAAALLGEPVASVGAMRGAAERLVALGAGAALVKGGHLPDEAVDVLRDDGGITEFAAPRIDAPLRGTGDLLAATIAAHLANGIALRGAVQSARARVRAAIAAGEAFAGTRVVPTALP